MNRKLIVCDFDKTIIKVNSFPLWIKFCLLNSIKYRNYSCLIKLMYLTGVRKIGLLCHEDYKMKVCMLSPTNKWANEFVCSLRKHLNKKLLDRLHPHLENTDILISTAAPDVYANLIPLLFDKLSVQNIKVHCSYINNGVLYNNYGMKKLDRLKAEFPESRVVIFATDDVTDMPLSKISDITYLVNNDVGVINTFKESVSNLEVIDPT